MNQRLSQLLQSKERDSHYALELVARYIDSCAASNAEERERDYEKVAQILDECKLDTGLSVPLEKYFVGTTDYYRTQYKSAQQQLLQAKNAIAINTPADLNGAIHWALGLNYRSLGEIDLAFESQLIASESIDAEGFFQLTYGYSYYQLGELHVSLNEEETAVGFYQQALEVFEKTGDRSALFRANNGLGKCYMGLDQLDKAAYFLNAALENPDLSDAEQGRGLCDLGNMIYRAGAVEEALETHLKSLEIRQRANLEDASSTSMISLAECYVSLGDYESAIRYLSDAFTIVKKYNATEKLIQVNYWLAKAHEGLGDLETALKYYTDYDQLNSKVRNEQERKVFKLKNAQIERQRLRLADNNKVLSETLDELARVKRSRTSLFFSIGTAIVLVLLTEVFLDPVIDSVAYNQYISLGVKVLIALLLKPMESLYERILFRKALKAKEV